MERIYFRGFTLVDLVITLSIAAILFAAAIPAFSDLIKTNRLSTQISLFARAVNFARSDAIKQNRTTFICARVGEACGDGSDWSNGWLVYFDLDSDDSISEEEILGRFDALEDGYSLKSNVRTPALRMSGNGQVRRENGALPLMSFRLCAPQVNADDIHKYSREIVINATGRMRIQFGRPGKTRCP